jgi:hypothetical protein
LETLGRRNDDGVALDHGVGPLPLPVRACNGKGIEHAGLAGNHPASDRVEVEDDLVAVDGLFSEAWACSDDVLAVGLLEREVGVADADGLFVLGM